LRKVGGRGCCIFWTLSGAPRSGFSHQAARRTCLRGAPAPRPEFRIWTRGVDPLKLELLELASLSCVSRIETCLLSFLLSHSLARAWAPAPGRRYGAGPLGWDGHPPR